jgi:hypothetical protein
MSDIKLFRIGAGTVDELTGTTDTIEKSVQTLLRKTWNRFSVYAFSPVSLRPRMADASTRLGSMKTAARLFSNTKGP